MCGVELKAAILMVILNHPLQPSCLNTHLELHLFFQHAIGEIKFHSKLVLYKSIQRKLQAMLDAEVNSL